MKKIAIISFFHYETSLCLAKYLSKQKVNVDYYAIVDLLRDKGCVSGFEYTKASKHLGLHLLTEHEIPEIYAYTKGLNIKYYLLRILSYSNSLKFFNFLIFIFGFYTDIFLFLILLQLLSDLDSDTL